ncbi:HD domain-containing protein [Rhizobium sp. WYJ-E13]|uniref:HD domain-containing protein n=1 Tax=Rhizobium sp. WYJ-E13 TaxID=2849093 RepID=UPI001C1EB90C|nr:HD domain-containing protein [Rhizobium sp. WYJ-E13]QWW70014.1 HD domain-containing protein [Rhizobium sp. WYJ-E13]
MFEKLQGIGIPDSKIAREVTEFIRDTESDLLFHHSARVYLWGAITGNRNGMIFDPELLYTAAMFHDLGLTERYHDSQIRFEIDSANAAREFLQSRGFAEREIEIVWNAVALHTTPGIPEFMRPEIALVQAGAGMDVVGRGYDEFSEVQREAVLAAFPREDDFANGIIDAFHQGMKHRPQSTFGTFNDDVLAFKDPEFQRVDICMAIFTSRWNAEPYRCSDQCDHAH